MLRYAVIGLIDLLLAALLVVLCLEIVRPAHAHEIYTGVRGKDGQLCCGGHDCNVVLTRPTKNGAEFLVGGEPWDAQMKPRWVEIPSDRITYMAVPGDAEVLARLPDPPPGESYGHFCARLTHTTSAEGDPSWFDGWHLYCAFITPGGS